MITVIDDVQYISTYSLQITLQNKEYVAIFRNHNVIQL